MKALLLFDIDGTLIWSGGAGERALRRALTEALRIDDDLDHIEICGRTDRAISRQILDLFDPPSTGEKIDRFLDVYLRHLEALLPATQGRILPGIPELLARLRHIDGVGVGLLTGNIRRGAELKLSHYGIWDHFPFGAFSDDSEDRNELGPFALARAARHAGRDCAPPPERVYVIGDTPHDIACGKVVNARTVAVATGRFSTAQLRPHNPDYLLEDFSDWQDWLSRACLDGPL